MERGAIHAELVLGELPVAGGVRDMGGMAHMQQHQSRAEHTRASRRVMRTKRKLAHTTPTMRYLMSVHESD